MLLASLPMYDRPELKEVHQAYWSLIQKHLIVNSIPAPKELTENGIGFEFWTHKNLVLSQTCGMPYRTVLHDKCKLIGTPDYGLEGCKPGYYRSAIIVRKDATGETIQDFKYARLAYNSKDSQSGFAAIFNYMKTTNSWFASNIETTGHAQSANAVANGKADIASIDAVTWCLIEKYDALSNQLRVLEWTEPTPGLPLICSLQFDRNVIFDCVSKAIQELSNTHKNALGIRALIKIDAAKYLQIPNPTINM